MRNSSIAVLLVALTAACQPVVLGDVYDFGFLTLDQPVSGQDNWRHNDAPSFGLGLVQVGNGAFNTQLATMEAESLRAQLIRENDSNFSFALSSSETAQIVEFDFQSDGLHTGGLWQGILSLTVGAGPTGLGPGFGVSGIGPTNDMFYYRDGFFSEWGEPLPESVQPGDWLRLRATIDFTVDDGFGGVGSLSMSYANLSAGETTFTPVDSIQNVQIHLFGAPEDINSLNLSLIRDDTDHNIQIDNISIGPNPNSPDLPTADHNNDGQVDAADYTVIIDHGLGQDAYDDWVAAFGSSAGGGAIATPEPATLVLLTIAIAGAVLRCRTSLIGVTRK